MKECTTYRQAAIGAILDLGLGADVHNKWLPMAIQAHLQRAGYHIGGIDGCIGRKTYAALKALELEPQADKAALLDVVMELESSPYIQWTPT